MWSIEQIETLATFVIYAVFNEMHKYQLNKDIKMKAPKQ